MSLAAELLEVDALIATVPEPISTRPHAEEILERFGVTHILAPPVTSRSLARFFREHTHARDVPTKYTLYVIRKHRPSG